MQRKAKEFLNEVLERRAVLASTSEDYVSACLCFNCRPLLYYTSHQARSAICRADGYTMTHVRESCICIVCLESTLIMSLTGWFRLNEIFAVPFFHQFLPGRLSQNWFAWNTIQDYCEKPNFFPEFVCDLLFTCDDPTFGWEPKKRICRMCLIDLLHHGVLKWLVARLIKGLFRFA